MQTIGIYQFWAVELTVKESQALVSFKQKPDSKNFSYKFG